MSANPARTLLSPDNHSLLMIDHQYLQMLTLRSHNASELIDHTVALVEAAAIFDVPVLTIDCHRGASGSGRALAEATKAVTPIDRSRSMRGKTRASSTGWRRRGGRRS